MLVSSWPAAALPSPKSKVILILGGRIGEHNAAGLAQFDLAMIEALEQRSDLATRMDGNPVPVRTKGPPVRDLPLRQPG